jgi:hypothetical protein
MLKKFIASLFKSKANSDNSNNGYLVAQLNDKVGPIDRGLTYEDPLDEFLKNKNYGEVTGGGSYLEETGEIACCDIEIKLSNSEIDRTIISNIILKLEALGAPKGSVLTISKTKEEIPFGKKEGLALYIDGQNLPPEVYSNCDINFVISELHRLTNIEPNADRNWEGKRETALYFFSDSFEQMKASISDFIVTYPLCKGARIVQIA